MARNGHGPRAEARTRRTRRPGRSIERGRERSSVAGLGERPSTGLDPSEPRAKTFSVDRLGDVVVGTEKPRAPVVILDGHDADGYARRAGIRLECGEDLVATSIGKA